MGKTDTSLDETLRKTGMVRKNTETSHPLKLAPPKAKGLRLKPSKQKGLRLKT